MPAEAVREQSIRRYGQEIFARMDRRDAVPFSPSWFDDVLMNTTMSAEKLKVQLFRFIDTLPLLKDPAVVADHLKEYLGAKESGLPYAARRALQWLPGDGWAGGMLAGTARKNAEHMARKFIAGSNVEEAIESIKKLRGRKYGFTIDLLGEATITEAEADGVRDQYFDLVHGLPDVVNNLPEIPLIDRDDRGPIPRVNISVKLSALFSQFDPIDPEGTTRCVLKRLRPILQGAKKRGEFVNFDMEQHSFKDTTLHIFKTVLDDPEFRDWPHIGIAIQAYLRDTEEDLRRLLEVVKTRGTPIAVRLVKGAYWDYETVVAAQNDWPIPVWTEKWQSDACFERCARFLLENHEWIRPAFGSHNVRSISHVLATAEDLNVPRGAYEFQMLFGMADEFKDALVGLGQRIRIYTPYGQLLPGMAYLVRRLLENTSNESFLRASFRENITEERLLMNPVLKAAANGKQTAYPRVVVADESMFHNEPLADFSREESRRLMKEALATVKARFGRDYPAIVNGAVLPTDRWHEATNPSRKAEKLGRWAGTTPMQAAEAVAAAKKGFPAWRNTPVEKRAEHLRNIAAVMRKRKWELSAWAVYETAKPWREADADIAEAIDFCEYYARLMVRMSTPKRVDVPGEENSYFYEPRGVAVVIAPWNFPLAIMAGMSVAALVAGNTVIFKPAEQSTLMGAMFAEVLKEAGVPSSVWHFLPGIGEEIGPTLVQSPDVDMIAFTGSQNVGLWINSEASKTPPAQHHVKRVIAELGGKNAAIVDADADLDEAVKGVLDSAFGYSGQKCSACSRAIVLESLHDQFLHRLIEAAKSLTIAASDDPGCSMGPVIDADARARIEATIAKGKQESRLAYAGELGVLAEQGHYVAPHIFADVKPESLLAQEEIFGPVLAVIKAKNLDHALEIANGTRYALTGGVFSRSPSTLERVKRDFRVGNLYVNRKITGALVERQPFGGFKLSGIGSKAGGPDYLLQFVVPRVITENTMRRGFAPTAGE